MSYPMCEECEKCENVDPQEYCEECDDIRREHAACDELTGQEIDYLINNGGKFGT